MDDVIVVGGRCAGAPAAMLLARAGLRVRVIERSARLGDTLSGHVIKPSGTARLRAWGLLDTVLAAGCPSLTGGKLWIGEELVPSPPAGEAAASPAVPARCPGAAPRRRILDPVLLDAARQAGATIDMGTSVRGLLSDGTRVTGVRTDSTDFPARLVIGADGRNSRVARLVGAGKYIDCRPATYAYYTYWRNTSVGEPCVFFMAECFIGMMPTNDDLALVFFQAPHAGFRDARRDPAGHYLNLVKSHPAAAEVLGGGAPAEPVRGTADLPTFFRVSAGDGWALIGDAGHHKDPLIARGITDAFRDAELVSAAITTGWDGDLDQALGAYPRQRDACARPISAANDSVASGIGSVPLATLAHAMNTLSELEATLDPPVNAQ